MCNFYLMYWVDGQEKLKNERCQFCSLLSEYSFKIFLSLFKSLPFRCVSVGPPVYSWGRIWPIGGNFSISYFKSSIQISINKFLSFDIILFLRGTRYGPIGVTLHSPIIYPTSYLLVSYMYVYQNISGRENLYLHIKSWSLVEQDMTHMGCNVYLFFL